MIDLFKARLGVKLHAPGRVVWGAGNLQLGILLADVTSVSPQYRVVCWTHDPFNLCDFPLVTLTRLLY